MVLKLCWEFPFWPHFVSPIVWEIKKVPISAQQGVKNCKKSHKFSILDNSDQFGPFSLDQKQFFKKSLTFWKALNCINSKMQIFQEILTFFQILASKIDERGNFNQKIRFKAGIRPPAEHNLAFPIFSDNRWRNILANLGILTFFLKYKFGRKCWFRAFHLISLDIWIWEVFISF